MEEVQINISVGRDVKVGEETITANMVGEFLAVHEDPHTERMFGAWWAITHVPTGYAIRQRIDSREDAVAIAEEVKDMVDWNFTDPMATTKLPGIDLVMSVLYPDKAFESADTGTIVERPSSKLQTLAENEGFEHVDQFIEAFHTDSVIPGICMNDDCDYTVGVEPDATSGWCELCDTKTVQSGLILAGLI